MTPVEIAAALDGREEGQGWRCRCPVHGGRSLLLADGRAGRLLIKCWAGCASRDVLAELRRRGLFAGIGDPRPQRPDPEKIRRQREAEVADQRKRTALALDMWRESESPQGAAAERYLRSRGYTGVIPPTLRALGMHGSYGRHPSGARRPQMIGLVEHVEFGPVAVSRTFLAPDGSSKASVSPARLFTGPVGGGAVRLAPVRPDRPLAVGEGIETVLSVMQACHLAGWAALSAVGLERLILPPEVRTVLICADHDANGAGERAARRARSASFPRDARSILRCRRSGWTSTIC